MARRIWQDKTTREKAVCEGQRVSLFTVNRKKNLDDFSTNWMLGLGRVIAKKLA